MTRPNKLALQLAAVLLLTVTVAAQAYPEMPWTRRTRPDRIRPALFTTAGVYGGVTGDQVIVDGIGYNLRPGTQAYLIGTGLVPMMDISIGSRVQVSGLGSLEAGTVNTLIVRPADEDRAAGGDMSRFVRIRSAATPN